MESYFFIYLLVALFKVDPSLQSWPTGLKRTGEFCLVAEYQHRFITFEEKMSWYHIMVPFSL